MFFFYVFYINLLVFFFLVKICNLNFVVMWIGINDRGIENRFMWTDGLSVVYLYWGNGKVNG